MRRAIPLVLLLALPAACAAPTDDALSTPTPTTSKSATPSPTPTATPAPRPSRSVIAWADMPPISPTSIDFEPDRLPPPLGSIPRADAVSALVHQQPTKYTSVVINTPGLIVTLPDGPDLAERKKAILARTKAPVRFAIAIRSQSEQYRLQEQLARSLMSGDKNPPEVVAVGTDRRGAVIVTVNEELDTTELRKALKKRYGIAVVFESGGVATLNGPADPY